MGAWPGKVILGLTGNIATGKSVVRKMLEHLGAYGIDADALTHRAMAGERLDSSQWWTHLASGSSTQRDRSIAPDWDG